MALIDQKEHLPLADVKVCINYQYDQIQAHVLFTELRITAYHKHLEVCTRWNPCKMLRHLKYSRSRFGFERVRLDSHCPYNGTVSAAWVVPMAVKARIRTEYSIAKEAVREAVKGKQGTSL